MSNISTKVSLTLHPTMPSNKPIESIIKFRKENASRRGSRNGNHHVVIADDPTSWPDLPSRQRSNLLSQSLTIQPSSNNANATKAGSSYVTNAEDPQLFNQLLNYSRMLQTRVKELEQQLQVSKITALKNERELQLQYSNMMISDMRSINSLDSGDSGYSNSRKKNGHDSIAVSEQLTSEIKESMGDIDLKVLNLRELFRKGDPMDERNYAATKIIASVRGFLCRMRWKHYQRGMTEWKWIRCRNIVYVLDLMLNAAIRDDSKKQRYVVSREIKVMYSVFSKWLFVVKQSAPLRRRLRAAAEYKIQSKKIELMRTVFLGLKSVCVGHLSVKNANKERHELIVKIRNQLSEQLKAEGKVGIVLESEVMRVLYRTVLTQFLNSKRNLQMKATFNGFKMLMTMTKRFEKISSKHWFDEIAGTCFYAWSDYIYLVSQGLDRRRWKGPRNYEIRYNQKRIDTFAQHRILRYVFKPWASFFRLQSSVKNCYQRQIANFVKANFMALVTRTKEQRRLRENTIANWKSYARIITQGPFDAWASYYKSAKNNNNEQARIVNKYCKWKMRQYLTKIVRTWRHQALYGRIDGMYTRQMLVQSLSEQKQLCTSLERMMSAQTIELEECMDAVEKEINKRREIEVELTASNAETNRYRMICHHTEEELKRVEAIVDVMAMLNPRQIDHLKALQVNFKFKERKIELPKQIEDDFQVTSKKKKSTAADVDSDGEAVELADAIPEGNFAISMTQNESDGEDTEEGSPSSDSRRAADNSTPHSLDHKSQQSNSPSHSPTTHGISSSAANTSAAVASITSDDSNTPHPASTKAHLPISTASEETPAVQADAPPIQQLPHESKILLDRVQWLVCRFQNMESERAASAPSMLSLFPPSSNASIASAASVASSKKVFQLPQLPPTPTRVSLVPSSTAANRPEDMAQPEDAAKMLISIIDFLSTGDVTALAPTDRRDWTNHILSSTMTESASSTATNATTSTASATPIDSEAIVQATELITSRTWRSTLMSLKTMFPGAGNYSGIGVPLESETKTRLYTRILDMRSSMESVIKIQERKYASSGSVRKKNIDPITEESVSNDDMTRTNTDRLVAVADSDAGGSDGNIDAGEADREDVPINLYSSTLGLMFKPKSEDNAYIRDPFFD